MAVNVLAKNNPQINPCYTKKFDIKTFHVSAYADCPQEWRGNQSLGGIILFQYFGEKKWHLNGIDCETGYIIVKKVKEIEHLHSEYGQVHGKVYLSLFGEEIDPDNIQGAGFSYNANTQSWHYSSTLLNSPNRKHDLYHDDKRTMNKEQKQALNETLKKWIKTKRSATYKSFTYNISHYHLGLYENNGEETQDWDFL